MSGEKIFRMRRYFVPFWTKKAACPKKPKRQVMAKANLSSKTKDKSTLLTLLLRLQGGL